MAVPNKRSTHNSRRQRDINELIASLTGSMPGESTSSLANRPFITVDNQDGLSHERRLRAGSDMVLTDNGPNSSLDVARSGNKILRFNRDQSLLDERSLTPAGLSAALAGASLGDIVFLPACYITINPRSILTVPDGVHVVGQSVGGSTIDGAIILGSGATLENLILRRSATDSAEIVGVTGGATGSTPGRLASCRIEVSNTGDAVALDSNGIDLIVWNSQVVAESSAGNGVGLRATVTTIYLCGGHVEGSTSDAAGNITLWDPLPRIIESPSEPALPYPGLVWIDTDA
jgi:hypothetical protein